VCCEPAFTRRRVYPQNGDRIVATDSVTSLHRVHARSVSYGGFLAPRSVLARYSRSRRPRRCVIVRQQCTASHIVVREKKTRSVDRPTSACCCSRPILCPKTSSIVAALSDARCVLLKAKFHYADPTGPARTLSETRTDQRSFSEIRVRSVRAGPCSGI